MKVFAWTTDADRALRRMLREGYTTSGAAELIGCRHIELVERAMRLGVPLPLNKNLRVAALISQLQREGRIAA